jgi:hypothetical protein
MDETAMFCISYLMSWNFLLARWGGGTNRRCAVDALYSLGGDQSTPASIETSNFGMDHQLRTTTALTTTIKGRFYLPMVRCRRTTKRRREEPAPHGRGPCAFGRLGTIHAEKPGGVVVLSLEQQCRLLDCQTVPTWYYQDTMGLLVGLLGGQHGHSGEPG